MLKCGVKDENMGEMAEMESCLKSAEESLGVKLTVIDNRGSLHNGVGRKLFPGLRQSHKKNAVCELGFCHKCIERCRYWALAHAEKARPAHFTNRCWKGLMEVVAPVWLKGGHCAGLLYAGIWREPGRKAPRSMKMLPPEIAGEYLLLEEFDAKRAKALGETLCLLAAGLAFKLESLRAQAGMETPDRRELIREHVFESANGKVSLKSLGERLGLSPSRAGHAVKELFGRGIEALVMEERMNRAKNLLDSTSLPIGEVASQAGFADQFGFSRLFKRSCGVPPKSFRKRLRLAGKGK